MLPRFKEELAVFRNRYRWLSLILLGSSVFGGLVQCRLAFLKEEDSLSHFWFKLLTLQKTVQGLEITQTQETRRTAKSHYGSLHRLVVSLYQLLLKQEEYPPAFQGMSELRNPDKAQPFQMPSALHKNRN